ncbi:hypothetical protein BJ875DRAFT_89508 [Amylocarpus encephaloides]|uniref:G domain-containing protein n=1 Tax=Amylocarpus encephaloides TaxID=45428 RepID=A0A9P8C4R6_9HELO|nr:hypothetical protein BJ875DRAFT_89508 [Amylocarpus encephaloides]
MFLFFLVSTLLCTINVMTSPCVGSVKLLRGFTKPIVADIPVFLCPGLLRTRYNSTSRACSKSTPSPRRHTASQAALLAVGTPRALESQPKSTKDYEFLAQSNLPQQCPGCGALSQTILKDEAGYYNIGRKSVKHFVVVGGVSEAVSPERTVIQAALENAKALTNGAVDLSSLETLPTVPKKAVAVPVCDRCHNLKEHSTGVSIQHPSLHSIQDTIFESPYKYNHVYHVLDAADFPMSLIPGLRRMLHITPQRSLNRRSKTGKFYSGQKTEISFIIQRADLLAHKKEQVDRMMPYLREVLRDSLGRSGRDVRLGNVRCVSARQEWWTKELKEEVYKRGGGGWMVGKVNVGKSQLLHHIFPKGRTSKGKSAVSYTMKGTSKTGLQPPKVTEDAGIETDSAEIVSRLENSKEEWFEPEPLNISGLLPPAAIEVDYPEMPLISSLPGTTASPIRLPFGNGKGELIDLPGLARSELELHVQPQHRASLVMRSRIKPEQQVIKPSQSLLLGGFIRITPTTPDLIFLAYSFMPLEAHVTRTEDKAIPTQLQTREASVENISMSGTGEKITSAGKFYLKWDVTKERSGALTSRNTSKLRTHDLPFRIFSTDILIEGCGWVELVAEVRKRNFESEFQPRTYHTPSEPSRGMEELRRSVELEAVDDLTREPRTDEVDPMWPAVEVFTPEGKFISSRRPMNAWLNVDKKPGKSLVKGRPRKSMKGAKKAAKMRSRVNA